MDKIRQLQDMINESNRIVFFGGAGVSTESNIPDFGVQTDSTNKSTATHRNRL